MQSCYAAFAIRLDKSRRTGHPQISARKKSSVRSFRMRYPLVWCRSERRGKRSNCRVKERMAARIRPLGPSEAAAPLSASTMDVFVLYCSSTTQIEATGYGLLRILRAVRRKVPTNPYLDLNETLLGQTPPSSSPIFCRVIRPGIAGSARSSRIGRRNQKRTRHDPGQTGKAILPLHRLLGPPAHRRGTSVKRSRKCRPSIPSHSAVSRHSTDPANLLP